MTSRKDLLEDADRIVIKVGTSSITMGGDTASPVFMDSVADQVKALRDLGKEVLLVTSGAIGIGLKAMGARPKPREIPVRQAAASVGQGLLMQRWTESFQRHGIVIAQILITLDDYSNRERVVNLNNTIDTLLEHGVVPVFNENDAICIKEIGPVFGDNDTLSAVIASRIDADLLIIVSDVDGLYDRDPRLHPDAALIPMVTEITEGIRRAAGRAVSGLGTGGMETKLRAAGICRDAGCSMIILSNDAGDALVRAALGEDVGTLFVSDSRLNKKRRWLKAAHAAGSIAVDEGALRALESNRSLLPVGVTGVSGRFHAGDVVTVTCGGVPVAKGITNHSSEEIGRIRGLHSDRVPEVLGRRSPDDVIVRENLVLL